MNNQSIVINISTSTPHSLRSMFKECKDSARTIIGRRIENEEFLMPDKGAVANKAQVIFSAKKRPKSMLVDCQLYLEKFKGLKAGPNTEVAADKRHAVKQSSLKIKEIEKKLGRNNTVKLSHCKTAQRIPRLRIAEIEAIQHLNKVMREIGSRNKSHKKLTVITFRTQQSDFVAKTNPKPILNNPKSHTKDNPSPRIKLIITSKSKTQIDKEPNKQFNKIQLRKLIANIKATTKKHNVVEGRARNLSLKWGRGKSNSSAAQKSARCTMAVLESVNVVTDVRMTRVESQSFLGSNKGLVYDHVL
eukprot:TRINITY_DN14391_c0_g1_i2.p2 TRINITY_DN14391_c0_g1~~TRINITY_DN14391_c0_g1_i2.p2  ORF type:complete len:303 (+),score=42.85 TRINITY_DN14391_c0_g1_i2:241-1149(+)